MIPHVFKKVTFCIKVYTKCANLHKLTDSKDKIVEGLSIDMIQSTDHPHCKLHKDWKMPPAKFDWGVSLDRKNNSPNTFSKYYEEGTYGHFPTGRKSACCHICRSDSFDFCDFCEFWEIHDCVEVWDHFVEKSQAFQALFVHVFFGVEFWKKTFRWNWNSSISNSSGEMLTWLGDSLAQF